MKIKTRNIFIRLLIVFWIFISPIFLIGCWLRPNIKITNEYVYNGSWGRKNLANMSLWKIELDDKVKQKDINTLRGFELVHNTTLDTSFYFITVPHNENIRKIYFDRKNNGIQWYIGGSTTKKTDIIGKLELDTWYLIGGLYKTWTYYVYVDKKGTTHVWSVNPVNI